MLWKYRKSSVADSLPCTNSCKAQGLILRYSYLGHKASPLCSIELSGLCGTLNILWYFAIIFAYNLHRIWSHKEVLTALPSLHNRKHCNILYLFYTANIVSKLTSLPIATASARVMIYNL